MTFRPEFLTFLMLLAIASLGCRFGGFWIMRFFTITPRLEAALKATPLAVMIGIVAPAAFQGSLPELAALVIVGVSMRVLNSDLVAALLGVTTVALVRSWQLAA